MKIFLAGATGFVGRNLVNQLLTSGHELLILRRGSSKNPVNDNPKITYVEGDVLEPKTWSKHLKGADAAINLVGIIREIPSKGVTYQKLHVDATKNVVQACKDNGIKRYLHMSANGAHKGAVAGYQKTKYAAEEFVKSSGLTYTIFRPSLIFGLGDGLTTMLIRYMKLFHVFPSFGDGSFKMQPIYVKDVAEVYANALVNENTHNQILHLGGPEVFKWIDLLKTLAKTIRTKCLFIRVPVPIMSFMARIFGRFSFFPMTRDQLLMLLEGNITPTNDAERLLNHELHPFQKTIEEYYWKNR